MIANARRRHGLDRSNGKQEQLANGRTHGPSRDVANTAHSSVVQLPSGCLNGSFVWAWFSSIPLHVPPGDEHAGHPGQQPGLSPHATQHCVHSCTEDMRSPLLLLECRPPPTHGCLRLCRCLPVKPPPLVYKTYSPVSEPSSKWNACGLKWVGGAAMSVAVNGLHSTPRGLHLSAGGQLLARASSGPRQPCVCVVQLRSFMPPVRLQANHRSSRRTSVAVKCAHAPERRVPNHVWQLEARDMHHGRGTVTADVRKGVKLACGNANTSKRGVEPHEVNNKKRILTRSRHPCLTAPT